MSLDEDVEVNWVEIVSRWIRQASNVSRFDRASDPLCVALPLVCRADFSEPSSNPPELH
jgi:hypothetical protein